MQRYRNKVVQEVQEKHHVKHHAKVQEKPLEEILRMLAEINKESFLNVMHQQIPLKSQKMMKKVKETKKQTTATG